MFGKKETKQAGVPGSTTLISKNTEIVGNVHFSGTLMIEGHVKGNVYAIDGEHAQARVLESGKVEGEIRVPSLIINGTVSGDVFSSKHIELASKTVINGNVHYVLIEMVKGAQVNGKLVYSVTQADVGKVAARLPAGKNLKVSTKDNSFAETGKACT